MNKVQFRAEIACMVSLLASAAPALGDSACNAGFRDTTPAERAQITSVLKAAQAALPPAPEGWIIVVDPSNEIFVPAKMCRDDEAAPWSYGFSRTYRQVADAESRNKLLVDQAEAQRAAMEQRKPRMDAAMAKYQAIMQQQMALNQKNDFAGAERLQPQLEAAQKEYEALISEATEPAAAAATEKAFNRDLEMTIAVAVNPSVQRPGKGATAVAPPAGAKLAQRWHVETDTESNDEALYLFGAWKPGQGGMQPTLRAGVAPSGAHGLSVVVSGDPERVTQTVAAIDFAKLAAIVK
jgi:hypothetical protein